MITVTLTENSIKVEGHAGYARHGQDIVCASVSTILQLAQMGLRTLGEQYSDYIQIKEEDDE